MKIGDTVRILEGAYCNISSSYSTITMLDKKYIGGTAIIAVIPDQDNDYYLLHESGYFWVDKNFLKKVGTSEDISDLSSEDQQEIRDLIARKRRGVPKAKYIWIKKATNELYDGRFATLIHGNYISVMVSCSRTDYVYDAIPISPEYIIEWIDVERPF